MAAGDDTQYPRWKTTPLRANDIRDQNDKLVLRHLLARKRVSQSEVARETGLKAPTILRIFRDLESRNLIRTSKPLHEADSKRIGRRPAYYEPNPDALYAVGVDFWALSATAVVTNLCGEPISQRTEDFPPDVDAAEVVRRLVRIIRETIEGSGIPIAQIIGIGVGSPGVVDISRNTVINYSRIRNMRNLQLGRILTEQLSLPAMIHNNGAAIALSEYRYGPGREAESLMVLLVRGGIGCGLVRKGELFLSRGRTALEIGHMSVNFEDEPCSSGEHGCLEAYVNEQIVLQCVSKVTGELTVQQLDALIARANVDLDTILERPTRALTQAVISLSNLLNPEVFVIVSRSQQLSSFLASRIGRSVEQHKYTGRDMDVRVFGSAYDPVRAGRGVADLVFEKMLLGVDPVEPAPETR